MQGLQRQNEEMMETELLEGMLEGFARGVTASGKSCALCDCACIGVCIILNLEADSARQIVSLTRLFDLGRYGGRQDLSFNLC